MKSVEFEGSIITVLDQMKVLEESSTKKIEKSTQQLIEIYQSELAAYSSLLQDNGVPFPTQTWVLKENSDIFNRDGEDREIPIAHIGNKNIYGVCNKVLLEPNGRMSLAWLEEIRYQRLVNADVALYDEFRPKALEFFQEQLISCASSY